MISKSSATRFVSVRFVFTASGTGRLSTGLPIPEAAMAVTSTERGETRQTQSNESGFYTLPNLPAGIYRLESQKAGLDTKRVTALRVNAKEIWSEPVGTADLKRDGLI